MAKQALLDVLEQTIGKYVRNLDANSLNVAVWSGKIALSNLELDVQAVNAELDRQAAQAPNLALPVRVVQGHFDEFQVEVPWASLSSRSVVVRAKGLTVKVRPHQVDSTVQQALVPDSKKVKTARMESLQHAETLRKTSLLVPEGDDTASSSTFKSRLVRRIMENLQIEIERVHISLEDVQGTAGIILGSLSLVTTDQNGKRVFVDRSASHESSLFKALSIQDFGVYLDHDSSKTEQYLAKTILHQTPSKVDPQHSYILAPLSFQAQLRQADGTVCLDFAKYQLSTELSTVAILLSRPQLELARHFQASTVTSTYLSPLFPEYRPLVPVKGNTKEWWKYAVRCIGRLNGQRSWVEFYNAFQKRKQYIPLYKRHAHHATCPWIQPALTTAELDTLHALENDRTISVQGIMTWRSIADAQKDREHAKHQAAQQKTQKKSYFSSIFGSSEEAATPQQEEVPIHLSVQEIQELEELAQQEFDEPELSQDSKLCDLKFVLAALNINLITHEFRHLAALELGTVSVNFAAAANGAFSFDFALADLEVFDRVTSQTLFPSVLQSTNHQADEPAFSLHLEKTKEGNQSLKVQLTTFEAVASQTLLQEWNRFVSDDTPRARKSNPVLAQSMTGSVDLFYDAEQGTPLKIQTTIPEDSEVVHVMPDPSPTELPAGKTATSTSSDLSEVLVAAWNEKTASKAVWRLDVDIKAPVLILPEKCNDPSSKLLILDLGHLTLTWGNEHASDTILRWFHDATLVDSGRLDMKHLTFQVAKANDRENVTSIIDPISVNLDLGIENASERPRVCCIGVIPSISLNMSPKQGANIFKVLQSWSKVMEREDPPEVEEAGSDVSVPKSPVSEDKPIARADEVSGQPQVFLQIGLQRLSVILSLDEKNRLEAHLVSVYVSTKISDDGSSTTGLRMGWFWVLDMLESKTTRIQRLLAHSNLPESPNEFANKSYDILGALTKQGVFERGFQGSTDLADISYKTGSGTEDVLDATFSSLSIHWNPYAVQGVSRMLDTFVGLLDAYDDTASTLIMSPELTPRARVTEVAAKEDSDANTLVINARMKQLDLHLNSAIDDLPLFLLTVAGTEVKIKTYDGNMETSLSLGDVRVVTPENMGATLPEYRTLLGLAPGRNESLLTVTYFQGSKAIQSAQQPAEKANQLEAFAQVELSPMRLVYLQSQVMALVEYTTEGILGALTAQAATSAAQAAIDIADSVVGEKLFEVKARSFDLILPQAAIVQNAITIRAGNLDVEYHMHAGDGGGKAVVSLSDVLLRGADGAEMQENPIRMSVAVVLPADGVGTVEDQAMKVDISMPEANFIVVKSQYAQLLRTLTENTGEARLFLRDDGSSDEDHGLDDGETVENSLTDAAAGGLTHAGNQFIEKQKRLYLNVSIGELGVRLCGPSMDPLVNIAAVETVIEFQSHPDTDKTISNVSLKNLVCEDQRILAADRQYRYIVGQSGSGLDSSSPQNNFFRLAYTAGEKGSGLDVKVGSPQIVLIPDAISEILAFVQTDSSQNLKQQAENTNSEGATKPPISQIDASSNLDIEYATNSVSAETKVCRIVLVDLGSQELANPLQTSQLAETLVLQGMFSATLSTKVDLGSQQIVESSFGGHADAMEIFSAFGTDMRSPLQILEPSTASAQGSLRTLDDGSQEVEIRAATLTTFDFTLSMHNAALLSAITNSLRVALTPAETLLEIEKLQDNVLTEGEAKHIEELANALESPSEHHDPSLHGSLSQLNDPSVMSHTQSFAEGPPPTKYQVRFTMPETRVAIINDLQGLDEALLRVTVSNFVAGGDIRLCESPGMTFDCHMNTSVLADYFDTSCNNWNKLVVQPWEVTLKTTRARNHRFKSSRLSTVVDLESFPCCISFSEQFLVSLASASRMWSIYSIATTVDLKEDAQTIGGSLRASMAASAARNLITSLPYAVENHCGVDVVFQIPGRTDELPCSTGTIQYFRFEPPNGDGFGGRRLYGEDVQYEKYLTLKAGDGSVFSSPHLDLEFDGTLSTHTMESGAKILMYAKKEGKTTVLHLTSNVNILNTTEVPFNISVVEMAGISLIGVCDAHNQQRRKDTALSISANGVASKSSRSFSIPVGMLEGYNKSWAENNQATMKLAISPKLKDLSRPLVGEVEIFTSLRELKRAAPEPVVRKVDVTCHPEGDGRVAGSSFVVQVLLRMSLTKDNDVYIQASLEPRALIENRFPIALKLRTPMPYTFSASPSKDEYGREIVYDLSKGDRIEVFTPGPSIAVSVKPSHNPVAGSDLDWLQGGWIDLPLVPEFSLLEPVKCAMPFVNDIPIVAANTALQGNEFFVVEGAEALADLSNPDNHEVPARNNSPLSLEQSTNANTSPQRNFFITVCVYGVDHTGEILFEQVPTTDPTFRRSSIQSGNNGGSEMMKLSRRSSVSAIPLPFGAFAPMGHGNRVTLLPSGNTPLRILKMTMEADTGYIRSLPFYVEELPIGNGGVDTIPIYWENKKPSGYYAYRSIINEHQTQVHVVPEFLVFNGSKNMVVVKEKGQSEVIIEGGKVSRLDIGTREEGLTLALHFIELDCRTTFVRVDSLGMKVIVLRTNSDGTPIGSVCLQTAIETHGTGRLVVKIGEINRGVIGPTSELKSVFSDDFFRFRVRWTELQLILNEMKAPTRKWGLPFSPSNSREKKRQLSEQEQSQRIPSFSPEPKPSGSNFRPLRTLSGESSSITLDVLQQPVATIVFKRFTFDYQRVFKETPQNKQTPHLSPERSQMALIVHNVVIKDLTPDTPYPIVFDFSVEDTSMLDLCIRVRGPATAEMIKVDLFDLNLGHKNGRSERMRLTTSEEYVWRLLDLSNRIMAASGEFAGYALELEEDEEHGGFVVKVVDSNTVTSSTEQEYTPPKGDTLFDIDTARVSPFAMLVSFKRNPQKKRYKKVKSDVAGSVLMNYFSRRLKFTIDRADLSFAKYEAHSLKGPSDRLFEGLFAVYMSRMKFKLVTLLSAASLQDWKYLAARDDGNDEYVDGDILRATGNLTGKVSNLLLKTAGQTIGDGVSGFTRVVGNSIEKGSNKIGARRVGAGVNSVVSGVGDGVGSAVSGVGSGTGKVLKGAGQGIGHAIGGVAGGVLKVGRGITRGITKGDGGAVVDGFTQGVATVGGGFVQGAETAVSGAADGVLHAGRGLFSGVKSVGQGIGGAITGKKPEKRRSSVKKN
eukprot:Nitzschia sp. Nitz4//scaffold372_size14277//316//10005//NITZ4_008942-RA/size14277-snap-gene-0.12-mRNA-1//-1//CDS//3329549588//4846//frame0